jgi:hypothetical protein
MSHSHTCTHRHPTFPLYIQHLGVTVLLLLKVIWVTPGGDQALFLPLRGRPNIWTWVLTSLMGSTPLAGSCTSSGSVVHLRPSPWLAGRKSLSSGSNCLWAPVGITSPGGLGDKPQTQESWKTPSLQSWQQVLRNVMGISNWDGTKAVQQEAMLYSAGTDSADSSPKAEP